ncbi:MAG: LemA family protein [Prolixibacteraceae bacterium]|nr:LemA family protein [Prolixibacteraceae bacterium]MBN2649977.1 LemA family protein [Prolixibacteraceae bacterium]
MKKSTIIWIVVGLVVLLLFVGFKGTYNRMVNMEEAVTAQWSQVENVYQRRADLIPNLVNTVKGYAAHEQETLEAVINARSKATGVNLNAENLDENSIQQFEQAQAGLTSALSRLMVVVERYPDLKANQNFRDLQVQLEGTENRITNERRKFNEVTQAYNTFIRNFPQTIYARIFGFNRKAYFEAAEGADVAPTVEF